MARVAAVWRGKWVTLFPTECTFGADMVPCVRVKPKVPQIDTDGEPPF